MSRTTRSARVTALVVVAVLALGVGVSVGQRREAGITVWDDVNFEGATVTFRTDVPDLREFNFNDRISSLKVAPGEFWEVCENDNYGGRCLIVSGWERDLRSRRWNDTITSMRRVRGRDGGDRGGVTIVPPPPREEIVLFDQPGYRGVAQRLTEAVPGLGAYSNRAQSVQVLGGVWDLCDDQRWGGRCVRITSSMPDLARIGLRGVVSARPVGPPR